MELPLLPQPPHSLPSLRHGPSLRPRPPAPLHQPRLAPGSWPDSADQACSAHCSPLPPARLLNHRRAKAVGTPVSKCSPPKLVSLHVCLPQHCTARRSGAAQRTPCSARPYFTDRWRPALLRSSFPRRNHRCAGALSGSPGAAAPGTGARQPRGAVRAASPPAIPPALPAVAARRSPLPELSAAMLRSGFVV